MALDLVLDLPQPLHVRQRPAERRRGSCRPRRGSGAGGARSGLPVSGFTRSSTLVACERVRRARLATAASRRGCRLLGRCIVLGPLVSAILETNGQTGTTSLARTDVLERTVDEHVRESRPSKRGATSAWTRRSRPAAGGSGSRGELAVDPTRRSCGLRLARVGCGARAEAAGRPGEREPRAGCGSSSRRAAPGAGRAGAAAAPARAGRPPSIARVRAPRARAGPARARAR